MPAKAARHATFSVLLHRSGSRVSVVEPVPSGPRQVGQSAADTAVLARSTATRAGRIDERMIDDLAIDRRIGE
jgi:hypothetical protein